MDYLAAMRAFVRAVDLGSFSRAAAEAGTKVSTVSRHVTALEADLGAALLNRSTRALHLTEVGASFYDHAARIVAEVEAARLAASALNARPQGLLRVSLPGAFGRRHVVPHLPAFLRAWPDIRVDAGLTEATVDLIDGGIDVAIRIGTLPDSRLVATRLARHGRRLCASPDWLAAHPAVTAPGDLGRVACLVLAWQPGDAWYFRREGAAAVPEAVMVTGRVRADDSEALLDCALAGLGPALLPAWLVGEALGQGRLRPVLPGWEADITPDFDRAIWAVYPPKKIVAPKVRVFLDHIRACFGRPPSWEG